ASDEDPALSDRRRRVAPGVDVLRPQDAPAPGRERDDLAGAADRVDAGAVGGCARVEALVAEDAAAHIRAPEPVSVEAPQAEDTSRVRRDEDAVAVNRRARIDATARVVSPANAAGPGVRGEDTTVL